MTTYSRWATAGIGFLLLAVILAISDLREHFLTGAGVSGGALIAAIALGVVLTYRGSGVVNFANGAIAMYVAYVYAILRRDGDLFLPPLPNPLAPIEGLVHQFSGNNDFNLPDIPTKVSFGPNMTFYAAFAISILFCIGLGLVLHLLVFRPLRNAPPLAKVVASVGVLVYLQAVILRRFSAKAVNIKTLPFVKRKQVDLQLFKISQQEMFVAILVIVFAVLLWLLFQKTRFGLATRAAAENEKGAVVLGFSPDFLAGSNWVLSTVITGMLGILVASIQTLINPIVLPALIVPALTAALVGNFSSFGRTTFAAFVLGMQVPLIQYLGVDTSWFPSADTLPGLDQVLPLVLIVLVLYLAGAALPTRGAITLGRLPFSPTPPRWALRIAGPLLALAAAISGLFILGPGYRDALSNSLIGIIICLSVVVITGFVGQISLAQMAFAGISAFIVSKLSTEHGWPFPWPILVGAAVAMLAGLLVALPALRVRGVNLAIVTFAFAVAVDQVVFNNPSVNDPQRGALVKSPSWIDPNHTSDTFLGISVKGGVPNPTTALFCLLAAVILCYAVANLRRSTTGRQMLAMRSNERAAAAAGVNVQGTKFLAFAVSAFIAGIGGAVIAYRSGTVTRDQFSYFQSLAFFAFAYLGGIASVSGAVVGGTLVAGGLMFTFLEDGLNVSKDFELMLAGLGLILTAILNPEGIAGRVRSDGLKLKAKFERARAPAASGGGADAPESAPVESGAS